MFQYLIILVHHWECWKDPNEKTLLGIKNDFVFWYIRDVSNQKQQLSQYVNNIESGMLGKFRIPVIKFHRYTFSLLT